jgi:DNA-binding XRE family transcriptional regulator
MLVLERKVDKIFVNMTKDIAGNYIRAHRRRCGLSQKELGILVGYGHGSAIGRHERSKVAPPLVVALAYEVIFEISVAQLFTGFHVAVTQSVARNLQELKADLENQRGERRRSNVEKKQWLLKQRIG